MYDTVHGHINTCIVRYIGENTESIPSIRNAYNFHIWTLLDTFEHFLALLDAFGHFWALLDVFGRCWMLLDAFGRCWMLLDRDNILRDIPARFVTFCNSD